MAVVRGTVKCFSARIETSRTLCDDDQATAAHSRIQTVSQCQGPVHYDVTTNFDLVPQSQNSVLQSRLKSTSSSVLNSLYGVQCDRLTGWPMNSLVLYWNFKKFLTVFTKALIRYGLDRKIVVRFLTGATDVYSPKRPDRLWCLPTLRLNKHWGLFLLTYLRHGAESLFRS